MRKISRKDEEELRREKQQEMQTVGLIAWSAILAWVFIIWVLVKLVQWGLSLIG